MDIKTASFFLSFGNLHFGVPVCFGTRLGVSNPPLQQKYYVKDEKVYQPYFSPEFGGFSLENQGSLG